MLKLLEDGAPFVIDSDGQTALHQAAAGGHADTVAALILGGCDASVQDFVSTHTVYMRRELFLTIVIIVWVQEIVALKALCLVQCREPKFKVAFCQSYWVFKMAKQ